MGNKKSIKSAPVRVAPAATVQKSARSVAPKPLLITAAALLLAVCVFAGFCAGGSWGRRATLSGIMYDKLEYTRLVCADLSAALGDMETFSAVPHLAALIQIIKDRPHFTGNALIVLVELHTVLNSFSTLSSDDEQYAIRLTYISGLATGTAGILENALAAVDSGEYDVYTLYLEQSKLGVNLDTAFHQMFESLSAYRSG